MAKKKHFIISGIQGSGKGTQARLLEKVYGWVHIGTGALCRWHLEHRTIFGNELASINQGNLAADEIMIRLVQRRLDIHDEEYPFLLDGFPRNMVQAEYLFSKYEFAGVIYLNLDKDLAMQRAQGRMDAKRVRKDDNEETLKRRFDLYYENTFPLIKMYEDMGILNQVDGSAPMETVHARIVASLTKSGIELG